jgi:cytochrome c peroxidase
VGDDDRRDRLIVNTAFVNFGKALEAYLRTLVSRGSRFDDFVAGKAAALSDGELAGLKVFLARAAARPAHKGPTSRRRLPQHRARPER